MRDRSIILEGVRSSVMILRKLSRSGVFRLVACVGEWKISWYIKALVSAEGLEGCVEDLWKT